VHLAGEANAADLFRRDAGGLNDVADRLPGGAPPVGGILFGPGGARRRKRLMLGGTGSENGAVFRYEDGARSAGSDIDAKDRNRFVSVTRSLYSALLYFMAPCSENA
jgi:hypothetical protein